MRTRRKLKEEREEVEDEGEEVMVKRPTIGMKLIITIWPRFLSPSLHNPDWPLLK